MILLALLLLLQAEAPPAREKFAILAAEHDDPVMGWEFDPARLEAGFVRRAEFAPGYLAPAFQFIDHTVMNYLAQGNGEERKLLRIDWATWAVEEVLSSKTVHGLGIGDGILYVRTTEGLQIIDRESGKVRPMEPPCIPSFRFDGTWLVDVADGLRALLDVRSGKLLEGRYSLPPEFFDVFRFLRLSPDRRYLATITHLGTAEDRVVDAKLKVFDFKRALAVETKLRMGWWYGSGMPGGPLCHSLTWSADGSLVCWYTAGTSERLTLDAETLAVRSREKAEEPVYERSDLPPDFPKELKPAWESLKNQSGWPELRMGWALLKFKGLPVPDFGGEARFLRDGKRFLLMDLSSKTAYLGDLSTLSVRRFEIPPVLAAVPSASIYAVPAR